MLDIITNLIFAVTAIWLMLFVWIKMNARHAAAMKDVDPCRQRSGCAACSQECTQRGNHE